MSAFIKNERTGKVIEYPPYSCKLCGKTIVENPHDICDVCGWEDDGMHNYPDEQNGANRISYNQYKDIWESNKERIMRTKLGKSRLIADIFAQLNSK